MTDTKAPKPKTHLGLADLLIAVPIVVLGSTPTADDLGQGNATPITCFTQYTVDNWDAGQGAQGVADAISMGVAGMVDNALTVDGVVITTLALGARHYIKHNTSASRHTILSTRRHKFTLGS